MFTGIIEELGELLSIKRSANASGLTIKASTVLEGISLGDSIAVNGVCLTASAISKDTFYADVMNETFRRSSFLDSKPGERVNLERAMPMNGRFGGHIVSGHIDATGEILAVQKDDNAVWLTIRSTPEALRYCVEKGSITIDGISLTIATVSAETFKVSVIPHTIQCTNLQYKKAGSTVNLETDIIGKYIDKLMHHQPENKESRITEDFLMRAGF